MCIRDRFIGLPDYEARLKMFEHYARKLDLDGNVEFGELARITNGYSGADIYNICMEVQMKVVSEFFEEGSGDEGRPRKIRMEDFMEVIRRRKPSVDLESMEKMLKWASKYGTS